MNILEKAACFKDGKIMKQEFIDLMHESHLILKDYAEYLLHTEIKKIIFENGKVYMLTNEDILLSCNFADKTGIPLINLSFGGYEQEERHWIIKLIKDDDVIFDIGANYGWYSLNIAKEYPNANIYAFEPIKPTFDVLAENIKLNNFSTINIFNLGIGKENAELEFNFNKERSGATSTVNLLEREDVEKIKCTVCTLDSFVRANNISGIDFIKLDIEGAELFALQGAQGVLERFHPKIFIEMLRKWSAKFGYHPNDIIHFMNNLGYRCFEINNGKLCTLDTMTDETESTNFFFLHSEEHTSIIRSFVDG